MTICGCILLEWLEDLLREDANACTTAGTCRCGPSEGRQCQSSPPATTENTCRQASVQQHKPCEHQTHLGKTQHHHKAALQGPIWEEQCQDQRTSSWICTGKFTIQYFWNPVAAEHVPYQYHMDPFGELHRYICDGVRVLYVHKHNTD